MKLTNYAMIFAAAAGLAACGGGSNIVEPADLNNQTVFFAYDQSAIAPEANDNLLGQALYMKNHPTTKIRIEGNCDERGTTEYNLALGARRANAARSVIVNDGIDASRVTTLSNGKEKPMALGTGEAVWQYNRNAHTVVTAE